MAPPRSCFILLLALLALSTGRQIAQASIYVPELEADACGVQYRANLGPTPKPTPRPTPRPTTTSTTAPTPAPTSAPTQEPEPTTSTSTSHPELRSDARTPPHGRDRGVIDYFSWICPSNTGRWPIVNPVAEVFVHRAFEEYLSEPLYEKGGSFDWRHVGALVKRRELDANKPSLIFFGGWTQRKNARWLLQERRNFDQMTRVRGEPPANFIIFDWRAYSFYPLYPQAVSSVDHLADLLASFIGDLVQQHRFELAKIHIISYSLSAHIAGLAGRKLQARNLGQLHQITALDPTGVCFHPDHANSYFGDRFGLKPTDAKLVLASHFNMDGFGSKHSIGNVDVFVNGGKQQPKSCSTFFFTRNLTIEELFLYTALPELIGDHILATEMETNDPMPGTCHEVAYHCESMEKFLKGHCGSCGPQNKSCLMLGVLDNLYLDQRPSEIGFAPGTRMFITTGYFKFCIHHYQIIARLRTNTSTSVLSRFTRGEFMLQIDYHVLLQPRHQMELPDGSSMFTELLRLSTNNIKFRKRLGVRLPEVMRSIASLEIRYMSNIFVEERESKSAYYCPDVQSSELVLCSEAQTRPLSSKYRDQF